MAEIQTIALAHARCLDCGWLGEGFLTGAEARDDAEWHVGRCPGPVQANAVEYPTPIDSETAAGPVGSGEEARASGHESRTAGRHLGTEHQPSSPARQHATALGSGEGDR